MCIRALRVSACDVTCDYTRIAVVVNAFLLVAGIVTLMTLPALLLVRRCGWWWARLDRRNLVPYLSTNPDRAMPNNLDNPPDC